MTEQQYALIRLWLCFGFAACAVLFYLCLMPQPPQVKITNFDKFEHFTAYVLLGTWFAGILAPRYWRVFAGLTLFGGLIEIAQWLSGYRDGDIYDWVADTLGVIAGIGLARLGAMSWLRYIDTRVAAKRNHAG